MSLQSKIEKYSGPGATPKIYKQRTNFLFLTDGSMVYDYDKFNDCDEAIADAVVNGGEDLDEMISLVYVKSFPNLRDRLIKEIEELKKLQRK